MGRLKKLKKIRIHREGTHTLAGSLLLILAVNAGLYFGLECKIPFYVVAVICLVGYGILVIFFRCPIRLFGQENTEKIVLQYQGGKIPEDQLELTAQMPQGDGAPFKDVFRDMMRQQFPSGKKKEK